MFHSWHYNGNWLEADNDRSWTFWNILETLKPVSNKLCGAHSKKISSRTTIPIDRLRLSQTATRRVYRRKKNVKFTDQSTLLFVRSALVQVCFSLCWPTRLARCYFFPRGWNWFCTCMRQLKKMRGKKFKFLYLAHFLYSWISQETTSQFKFKTNSSQRRGNSASSSSSHYYLSLDTGISRKSSDLRLFNQFVN